MTREETLILLLQHYPDFLEAGRGGSRTDQQGSRLLTYDQDLDCPAFHELDKALNLMRNQGKQQAVKYTAKSGANDGATVSCSLATCRWHLLAWYIPERHIQPRSYHRKRHGRNETIRPEPQPVRHPEARLDRANAGLHWLNNHYDWTTAKPGLDWLQRPTKRRPPLHGLQHTTGLAA